MPPAIAASSPNTSGRHMIGPEREIVSGFLLVYAGLFPVVNPLGAAPMFLSLTSQATPAARNRLAFNVAMNSFAAHVLGAATVYLSIPANEAQRRALVEQMAPDLLVVFPETARCLDQKTGVAFATLGFDQAGSRGRLDALAVSMPSDPIPVAARASELGVIASSGGSTGVPKGSCRSFGTYSAMVSARSPKDRVQLINGPLAYLSQVLVDVTLLGGGRVVLRDAYDAADTLATIEAERITDLFLVEP
jgi:fatty-acyl-CoA synthase